jgi:hypothetical protein
MHTKVVVVRRQNSATSYEVHASTDERLWVRVAEFDTGTTKDRLSQAHRFANQIRRRPALAGLLT